MNRLLKIAQSATPCAQVQFRRDAYGKRGIRGFLRDMLAIANADVDGKRYIVTGINFDSKNKRQVVSIDAADFSGNPDYRSLVADFIEPPIMMRYQCITVDDLPVGVYEIGDCRDKPYMMRADYSETLRRGDAYARIDNAPVKIGRRMLQKLFEKRPQHSVPEKSIEIGFPGEIIQKRLRVPTVDLRRLPSMIEHAKLDQLVSVRKDAKNSGSTTTIARMVHTRLYGSDEPYEDRSATGILEEMDQIGQTYELHDQHFLFEENAVKLQLAIYNQSETPIQDASLTLLFPQHDALFVATSLPRPINADQQVNGSSVSFSDYPAVSVSDNRIQASIHVGEIPTGAPIEVLETPLRLCVGSELSGKRMKMAYKLYGSNLRQPVKGKLTIGFHDGAAA